MDIVAYNCHNFKANHLMINKLINNNDICFFIEHWLGNDEAYLFNQLCVDHSIIFKSDFDNSEFGTVNNRKGRPFGGSCWVIRNNLKIIEHSNLSNDISKIVIEDCNSNRLAVIGI